jgi:rhamnulokinase
MKSTCLAVDIGASGGRHILGEVTEGKIQLTELYRFHNGVQEKNGHLCWDLAHLADSLIEGMKAAAAAGYTPKTIGIDTWAVDFVLLDENDEVIGDAVSYRDKRTDGMRSWLAEEKGVTFDECYRRTGIQFQKFNSIYQLMWIAKEQPEMLAKAKSFLMIPDYLNFVLSGVKANEYTNASTTGLVSAETKDWDYELIRKIGLPEHIFQKILAPGTVLGSVRTEIAEKTGLKDLKVVLPATHDTGSAFIAVPSKGESSVFLSSGTWSLLGVERQEPITGAASARENFTNEGGYAYSVRYLKNIMGLWMVQRIRKEMEESGEKISFGELAEAARKESDLGVLLDVNDDRFLAPASMLEEVRTACREKAGIYPETGAGAAAVVFRSLAADYAATIRRLSELTGTTYTALHIVGGGCKNDFLNQLTCDAVGLPVYAGPCEGTALGNLMVQMIADGAFKNLEEARRAVKNSVTLKTYLPA